MSIINQRQSIRKFDPSQPIEQAKIDQLIAAGLSAPSSKNKRPWHFVVINDLALIANFATAHQNWGGLGTATALILVCNDLRIEEREGHSLMTCSAASQNILLSATEQGLASVWMGMYPDEERMNYAKKTLGMPDYICPISVIALGYPATPICEKIRVPEPEKVHVNHW